LRIHIKNMVCDRCKLVVRNELKNLGYHPVSVELGEVELDRELSTGEKETLDNMLHSLGFAIIDDKKSRLIEQIKNQIIELVHRQNNKLGTNLSDYLSSRLNHDYNYMTNLFSEVEGTTIEKYFIAQKIEKVKELLVYDELTLSQIAWEMNYSSVSHLSSQFKKVTGLTPSHFRQIRIKKRKPLDQV
jgi:AraC-like DNA-binding protein